MPSANKWAVVHLAVCGALRTMMVIQAGLCVRCSLIIARIVHKRADPLWV